MKPTRVIAIGVMLGSIALTGLDAQTLRNAQPPAEFPPASYKGKQYVDSRGCIYIRAGIDGNVTWVPRVTRSRKQICGYKPTAVAGATRTPPRRAVPAPKVVTITPAVPVTTTAKTATATATAAPKPAARTTVKASAKPAAQPTTAQSAKPSAKATAVAAATATAARKPYVPSPGPEPTVFSNEPAKPAPAPTGQTVRTATARKPYVPSPGPEPTVFSNAPAATPEPAVPNTRTTTARPSATARKPYVPSPGPEPTVFSGSPAPAATPAIAPRKTPATAAAPAVRCRNASTFSQQFINDGARCGPQATPPVTYSTTTSSKTSSADLPPDTRVVPRHVYENRQNTTNVSVPKGYKAVWKDDRLNPHRAEQSLRPGAISQSARVPAGFKVVDRGDDRYNPNRGNRLASGDAQTDMIWTRTVPRRLVPAKPAARVVRVSGSALDSPAEAQPPLVIRLSSRSAPGAELPVAASPAARPAARPAGTGTAEIGR